jgi:hypothetical protein
MSVDRNDSLYELFANGNPVRARGVMTLKKLKKLTKKLKWVWQPLLGYAIEFVADKLPIDTSLFHGRYVTNFILFPLITIAGYAWTWFVESEKERRDAIMGKIVGWFERQSYFTRIGVAGVVGFLTIVVPMVVISNIPPSERAGHGGQVASLPGPPPPFALFPVPNVLPVPEAVPTTHPDKQAKLLRLEPDPFPMDDRLAQLPAAPQPKSRDLTREPQQISMADAIAQLAVSPRPEFIDAPRAPRPPLPPTAVQVVVQ